MDIFEIRDGKFQFKGNTMIPDIPRPGGRYKVPFFAPVKDKHLENAVVVTFDLPCDGTNYEDSMNFLKEIAPNFSVISAAIIRPWYEQMMTVTGITSANIIKKERIKNVYLQSALRNEA
ncbi:MAG: hypothetical protein IJS47_02040 [Clostridia bacterium]|nr:hypothetical protein [Clostridia bacterium]